MANIFPIDFEEKLTMAQDDYILFSDSEDGNKIKKAQYKNLKGEPGTPGKDGEDGAAATITVGSTTTGAAGSSASVTNSGTSSAAVLDFTIPQGAKGEPGEDGQDGADGTAATITVGTTTTLPAGSSATVTNVGTSQDAILNFGIPKGDAGTGSGDVNGPASSTDGDVALFDGATGKLIKDSGVSLSDYQEKLTAGTNIQISASNVISATGGSDIVYATQAEYNALLPGAESDGKHYFIYTESGSSIVEGYYDMITDSFYSDSNLTNLITPTEGAYYKYVRYTTPIFFKYENGTFNIQKKNTTTVTKNTLISLSRSTRRELCIWNGRGIGIVCGWGDNYAQLLKRTDIDTVTANTEINSNRSDLYGGCGTKNGTVICGCSLSPLNVYSMTLDYDNNNISVNSVNTSLSYSLGGTVVSSDTLGFSFINEQERTTNVSKLTLSNGEVTAANTINTNPAPTSSNLCGASFASGKILAQGHTTASVGIGTPSADGNSITWVSSSNHNLNGANSVGSDRKQFIAVGEYNTSTLGYSFDFGTNWSTLTAQQNTGGQIYVDEIGDVRYTSETSTDGLGWIRFGTFLTEEELS